ncbi:expressed unknown protein [Seminavis robusta]|uniref:PNPLA domain-containing protein n=1 Tax=Seminavis robusta TaxID=568900 RepID=A0A9N8DW86_9STRA|nr:expressed unknown protein [Seminavis robusta]|eukprot:Sro405_g136110.1 n/a (265) ;mRNA; r:26871-27665
MSTNNFLRAALGSFCCCVTLIAFSWGYQQGATTPGHVVKDPNTCLYVPGAGFSGFFYTIGHLQAAPELTGSDKTDYYCYSAGCLATTAALANITVYDVYDTALEIQGLWRSGGISQFQVVEEFVDYLITTGSQRTLNAEAVAKMHIITSTHSNADAWLPETSVRTPKNFIELKEMLLQSAWIPGMTGDDWASDGHVDGSFTSTSHPVCPSAVNLPKLSLTWESLEFYSNILFGLNMNKDQGERFWSAGVKRGLEVAQRKVLVQP